MVAELDPAGHAAARDLDRRRNGAPSLVASGTMIGERWSLLTDITTRLAAMDAAGIDMHLVSPSPSHYYPFLAAEHAHHVVTEINSAIRGFVDSAPDRLRGLGVIALQHPDSAAAMLADAMDRCGLDGVEIGSFGAASDGGQANTVELSDPRLEEFWAAAARRRAIVFLHPFGCSLDERLDRFYLANTVSQPAENAVALSHLIFGGVLDRHPDLRIVAAHAGGYLPTTIGRSDRAWAVRPEAHTCVQPPSHYLRKIWFDSLTHDRTQLRSLITAVGPDRVVLGSDFPFDMGTDTPLADLRAAIDDESTLIHITGETARGLLVDSGAALPSFPLR